MATFVRRRPWRAALAWCVVAAALVAACGGGSSGPEAVTVGGQRVPASQLTDAVGGLCEARRQAPAEPDAARRTFYDRSHATLHVIARGLDDLDRPLAARLLEAKEAVEADLAPRPPRSELAADLGRLLQATRAGLQRLSVQAPACRS